MVEGSAAAWFGALGLEVTGVEEVEGEVVVRVQTPVGQVVFCGSCGRRALSKGRREVVLRDAPGGDGRPVRVRRNKRVWECRSPRCGAGSWTERSELAGPRRVLTRRAARWAVGRLGGCGGVGGVGGLAFGGEAGALCGQRLKRPPNRSPAIPTGSARRRGWGSTKPS